MDSMVPENVFCCNSPKNLEFLYYFAKNYVGLCAWEYEEKAAAFLQNADANRMLGGAAATSTPRGFLFSFFSLYLYSFINLIETIESLGSLRSLFENSRNTLPADSSIVSLIQQPRPLLANVQGRFSFNFPVLNSIFP